jgi:hypothetical protein
MYVDEDGLRSRGSQSWKDIATTMNEQAAGYGLGFDPEYTEANVQIRWVEVLRHRYEHVDKDASEKTMLDNRASYALAPPLKEDYEHEPKPKRQLLGRAAEAVGQPRFEELSKDRKGKRPEK